MPLHDDEMKKRREKREAQRRRREAEARRLKLTLALAAVVLLLAGVGISRLAKSKPQKAPEQIQQAVQETEAPKETKPKATLPQNSAACGSAAERRIDFSGLIDYNKRRKPL